MPNHVHLLLTPSDEAGCSLLMQQLGQRYVQYFNRKHKRTGTLWEGRFRSCLVESREYVLNCYRYIEMNPVRAEMVARPGEYRWSSFSGNTGSADNKSLRPHCEYVALAEDAERRHAAYALLFDAGEDAAFVTAIRAATNGGYALIGEAMKLGLTTNRRYRLQPGKPGRPAGERPGADNVSLELGL